MGGSALMAPPTAGTQIIACAEKFEKGLRDAFVDVEKRAQGRIEPFNGAGGAMPAVEEVLSA